MTRYELVKAIGSALVLAKEHGISATDYAKLSAYEDYLRYKAEGHKVTAIMYHLSEEYGISESKLYEYFARMKQEISL